MEFEDIIKILGVIAFIAVNSFLGSKKKKQKLQEARRRAEQRIEEQKQEARYNATSEEDEPKKENDFFAEVRKMLEEAESAPKKNDPFIEEPLQKQRQPLSSVEEDYFEEEYEQEEKLHFPERMPTPDEEAAVQTEIANNDQPITIQKVKKKSKIDLKQAIKHQIILERKYT